jgi:hypothetical protein
MTMALNYSQILNKLPLHILSTTSTNGIDDVASTKLTLPPNNVSIGSSNHLLPSLPKMWPPPSPRPKKKPLARPNSSNSSMPSPDTYTRYSRMPQDPCHLAKTNLLTGEIECLSNGGVDLVRGCLNNPRCL